MTKGTRVYMVSMPENADYAEWWYMVGLFSTRKKAQQFIKEHPIKKWRSLGRIRLQPQRGWGNVQVFIFL